MEDMNPAGLKWLRAPWLEHDWHVSQAWTCTFMIHRTLQQCQPLLSHPIVGANFRLGVDRHLGQKGPGSDV